jgi:homoserine dehydrogenase
MTDYAFLSIYIYILINYTHRFDTSHPIATLKGSDNIISFYTKRYGSNPLIIQGAG